MFTKPLTTNSNEEDNTDLRIRVDTLAGDFSISSCGRSSASLDGVIHAEGQYALLGKAEALGKFEALIPNVRERIKDVLAGSAPEKYCTRIIYGDLFARVVDYCPEFQTIQDLTLSPSGLEAIAKVRIDVGF